MRVSYECVCLCVLVYLCVMSVYVLGCARTFICVCMCLWVHVHTCVCVYVPMGTWILETKPLAYEFRGTFHIKTMLSSFVFGQFFCGY